MISEPKHSGGATVAPKELETRLSYEFRDPSLLRLALTHSTFASEARQSESNERLEFLGDSALSISITKRLYRVYPTESEGELSRRRQAIVSNRNLSAAAKTIGLEKAIRLGMGQRNEMGFPADSILANTVEAIIGALFLDGSFEAVEAVFCDAFDKWVSDSNPYGDPKSRLQERCHQLELPAPVYQLIEEAGPDHAKQYTWEVVVADRRSVATQTSKTKAQREAASLMLEQLEIT